MTAFAVLVSSSSGAALAQSTAGNQQGPGTVATAPDQATEAAASPVPPETGGVKDIIVTAQRRSENLQRVPIAISAVTSSQLNATGVTGIENIQVAVPGLSAKNANGLLTLYLRGIGTNANGPGFENPVALYVDGVYIGTQTVGLFHFNNIDRVEVLKGPQGTLFGRNATGGLIQIITRDPSQGDKFDGSLSYGNYNAVELQGYGSQKFSDDFAADLAVRYARHDGYGTNLYNGKEVYGERYDFSLRSKVVWSPGDFKFTLIGDYGNRLGSPNAFALAPGTSSGIPGVPLGAYPTAWDVNNDAQARVRVRSWGVSLKAETDLGSINISNLAAFRRTLAASRLDYDGTTLPITVVQLPTIDWQFSDELQISSPAQGRFTWVAGVYYYRARGLADNEQVIFANSPLLNPAFPAGIINFNGYQDAFAISGYAQGTFKLTDQLSVTGGARYSSEKRKLLANESATLYVPGSPTVPLFPQITNSATFSQPTFRAAINYQADPAVLVYASVNTGFKSGGFNVTVPTDPAYRPEKLTAYEVGEKADLFNRMLRLNSAAFYYDYRNIQVQIPRSAGTGITNGSKAEIYGLESEATVVPDRYLQFNAGVTLLHAKFEDYPLAPLGRPGGGVPVVVGSAKGNDLPNSPKLAFNVGATYTIPVGSNNLALTANLVHSSRFYFEADNVIHQNAYDQLNASATFNFDSGRYSLTAFGNNLTDIAVKSNAITTPGTGTELVAYLPPRTYGVRFGFNF